MIAGRNLMKKKLYLMRHGQTLFNVQKKNQGWCDSPLTELGHAQARRAGQLLREQGIHPDHFYASTSERASDTLEDVCLEAFGKIPPYKRLRGLKEWNFGAYEGKDSFLNPEPPFGDFFVPFGGDSQEELVHRMRSTLTSLMEDPEDQCVLAVSHGAACANFLRSWKEDNIVQFQPGIRNCTIFAFSFETETRHFSCTAIMEPDFSGLEGA